MNNAKVLEQYFYAAVKELDEFIDQFVSADNKLIHYDIFLGLFLPQFFERIKNVFSAKEIYIGYGNFLGDNARVVGYTYSGSEYIQIGRHFNFVLFAHVINDKGLYTFILKYPLVLIDEKVFENIQIELDVSNLNFYIHLHDVYMNFHMRFSEFVKTFIKPGLSVPVKCVNYQKTLNVFDLFTKALKINAWDALHLIFRAYMAKYKDNWDNNSIMILLKLAQHMMNDYFKYQNHYALELASDRKYKYFTFIMNGTPTVSYSLDLDKQLYLIDARANRVLTVHSEMKYKKYNANNRNAEVVDEGSISFASDVSIFAITDIISSRR
jgi:hypothetical protein